MRKLKLFLHATAKCRCPATPLCTRSFSQASLQKKRVGASTEWSVNECAMVGIARHRLPTPVVESVCSMFAEEGAGDLLDQFVSMQRTDEPVADRLMTRSTCLSILQGALRGDLQSREQKLIVIKWYNTMHTLGFRFLDPADTPRETREHTNLLMGVIRCCVEHGVGFRRKEVKNLFYDDILPYSSKGGLLAAVLGTAAMHANIDSMMRQMLTRNKLFQALEDMFLLVEAHGPVPQALFDTYLEAHATFKEESAMLDIFDQREVTYGLSATTRSYNVMMARYAKAKDVDSVLQIVEDLKQDGLELDSTSFSHLFAAFYNTSQHDQALGVLEEMVDLDVPVPYIMYSRAILLHAKRKNLARALLLLETMKQDPAIDLSTHCELYAHMLIACAKLNKPGTFSILYTEMKKTVTNVDLSSYGMIIKHLLETDFKLSTPIVLADLKQEMAKGKAVGTQDYYRYLLEGYSRVEDLSQVQALLEEIVRNKVPLSASNQRAALRKLGARNALGPYPTHQLVQQRRVYMEHVMKLLEVMDLSPNDRQLESYIDVLGHSREVDMVLSYHDSLKDRTDLPFDVANAILRGISKEVCDSSDQRGSEKYYAKLLAAFESFRGRTSTNEGFFPNIGTWFPLVTAAAHQADHQQLIFWVDVVETSGFKSAFLNYKLSRMMLEAFVNPPSWAEVAPHGAIRVAKAVAKHRLVVTEEWNMVLQAYRNSDVPDQTKWANVNECMKMMSLGKQIDEVSYMHLFQMIKPGNRIMVCKVFRHLRKLRSKCGPGKILLDNWLYAAIICHANRPRNPELEALIRLGSGNHYRSHGGIDSVVHQLREAIDSLELGDVAEDYFSQLLKQGGQDLKPEDNSFLVTKVFPILKEDPQFLEELQTPWPDAPAGTADAADM